MNAKKNKSQGKGEPCIRVSLRRLSMVVCDCCTLCADDAEARKSPLRCPRVQLFIENIKPR